MAIPTEWGIFAYRFMPFGLTNAPATFQQLMSHTFKEYLRDLEVYMDDLCIHSGTRDQHVEHLKLIFQKYRVYRICLNSKKCVLGAILAQPGEKNMDFPISYASKQLNSAEQNYTTSQQEGLGMIYAVKKFRHYLLANKFVFFTDHQALLYLVNKPCSTGRIV